ncbi:MAG: TIGR04282 family arsenosugar biosynthesis glycosyltransferase [Pseudomonadota bacterium]
MIPRHVVVFARQPRFGTVKTRLAADIGPGAALAFYRRTLTRLLTRLGQDSRWTAWLAVTPPAAARRRQPWQAGLPLLAQVDGDLGDRMAAAFRDVPPGPAVIVGSDIPDLRPAHVAAAFRLLDDNDAVFGPTPDGGYYLIGLRPERRGGPLFENVRWSTRHALADTRKSLPRGCRIAHTQELMDIDTGDDFARWRRRSIDG